MSSRFRVFRTIQRVAPYVSATLLLAFFAWVFFVTSARETIERLLEFADSGRVSEDATPTAAFGWESYALLATLGIAAVSMLIILVGFVVGRRQSRSLQSWFIFFFLLCAWLASLLRWNDIYWYGQGRRVSKEVAAAEKVVDALSTDWPAADGDYPQLGFVLGYPKEKPTSLILAGEPVPVGELRIAAVEKSKDGQLMRFQLASPNSDTMAGLQPTRAAARIRQLVSAATRRNTCAVRDKSLGVNVR